MTEVGFGISNIRKAAAAFRAAAALCCKKGAEERHRAVLCLVPVLFFSGAVLSACGVLKKQQQSAVPEYVFTYAENQGTDYPTTQGAYRFAALVKERTGGRIEILVYPDAELGDEFSVSDQMRFGGVDFSRVSLATMTQYSAMANVLMMPYIYDNSDHMWRVLASSVGDEVRESFAGTGIVPLSWYDAGARSFYTKKPIRSPEDMAGMSIRVQETKLMQDMIRKLGAIPIPLAFSEVYSALQTGKADGAENNYSSYQAMGHYEVASYFVEDEHMRVPELQIVSQSTLDKLSEEDRSILRACAEESAEYERKLWNEREETSKKEVVKAGTVVIELTPEEKKQFRDAVLPLYDEYCGNYMDLVQRIMEMSEN